MSTEEAFVYYGAKSLAIDAVAEHKAGRLADDAEVAPETQLSASDPFDL